MKRLATGEDGSLILEALMAALVIGVGILGIASLTGSLVRGNRQSDLLGSAAFAAQDEIEDLLAGAPLNVDGDLSPGPHPPDVGGSPRYQGLDTRGGVVAGSVVASATGYELLRRWVVTNEASTRCLRRVRVSVRGAGPASAPELAAAETFVNCP